MPQDARRRRRILIVEDDPSLREAYRRFFGDVHAEEFRATIVASGEQALDVLQTDHIDEVVLDWSLPDVSGTTLAKALRSQARTRGVGIMMVTARANSSATVQALEAGADDYLPKPFEWSVLLARLRSLARRRDMTDSEHAARRYPGLVFDFDEDRLVLNGRRVRLSPKESSLLKIFMTRPDIIHARSFLWNTAWDGESDGWEHTLAVTLSSLRKKLGPKWGARLECRPGGGYCFVSSP